MTAIVRKAVIEDEGVFSAMASEFISESGYPWTFSAEVTTRNFMALLEREDCAVLIAEFDGRATGVVILAFERDFALERIGYVVKFFVRRAARGTDTARRLMAESVTWFQENNVWTSFVSSTGQISPTAEKQFTNLVGKFGYRRCGPALMKEHFDG